MTAEMLSIGAFRAACWVIFGMAFIALVASIAIGFGGLGWWMILSILMLICLVLSEKAGEQYKAEEQALFEAQGE